MGAMPCSPKNVFQVISLPDTVIMDRNPVIIPTVFALSAAPAGEVNTKVSIALLLHRVRLGVP